MTSSFSTLQNEPTLPQKRHERGETVKAHTAEALSGIFSKPAERMADLLSSEELFPGGPAAGLRMLTMYTAFANRRLSVSRRQNLERAKKLLAIRARETKTQHRG